VTGASDRLRELLEHALRAGQPSAALRAMTALREELDAFERLQVARALDAGQSFGDIARAIGISRQAAHRRYRDLAGVALPEDDAGAPADRRLVVTSEARAAVTLAREEASRMGAAVVGSEHLLLGIMRSRAPSTAAVLETSGVTLADARRCAQPTLVEGAPPADSLETVRPGRGISAYARSVFELALSEATKRGDGHVGVDHILLASLEDPNGGACRTLCELGLDPEQVRVGLVAA
jgi:Clp amino terminal domain, pathogenicity island component